MHGHHSCFISDYYLQHAAVPVSRIAESLELQVGYLGQCENIDWCAGVPGYFFQGFPCSETTF